MSISIDEVRHVARLARLELDEIEILTFQGELNALLGHFSNIQGLNVAGISAPVAAVPSSGAWAEDEYEIGLAHREALRNAPVSKAGLFVVPTIIED